MRLTMGGEPTFVSIDDMDGDQWNTDGPGGGKAAAVRTPDQTTARRNGPPAACCTTARANGIPANPCPVGPWAATGDRTAGRCGRTTGGLPIDQDYGFGSRRSQASSSKPWPIPWRCSRRLHPRGYEDILYYLHKEQRLPVNVDPPTRGWTIPEDRARMVRRLPAGLGAVVGYVLPLQHGSWKSGPWPFRGEHMFLLPGDSPAGLRLPLESLPWVSKADLPIDHPLDPMAERDPLPDRHSGQAALPGAPAAETGEGVRTQPRPYETRRRCPANPPPGSSAPPFACSPGRDVCTSSCRRWPPWKAIWN